MQKSGCPSQCSSKLWQYLSFASLCRFTGQGKRLLNKTHDETTTVTKQNSESSGKGVLGL